jgi:WD40 repeat protein
VQRSEFGAAPYCTRPIKEEEKKARWPLGCVEFKPTSSVTHPQTENWGAEYWGTLATGVVPSNRMAFGPWLPWRQQVGGCGAEIEFVLRAAKELPPGFDSCLERELIAERTRDKMAAARPQALVALLRECRNRPGLANREVSRFRCSAFRGAMGGVISREDAIMAPTCIRTELVLLGLLLLASLPLPMLGDENPMKERSDQYGDPLPPGALARLGTVRFRHSTWVHAVACSPDGKLLASGDSKVVRLWDAATGKEVRQFVGHEGCIRCVAYSRDGKQIASGGDDNTVRVWDAATGKELRCFRGHQGEPAPTRGGVVQVLFPPDCKTLISSGMDNTIRCWDVATGTELRQFAIDTELVWTIALAADGKTLAAFSKKHPGAATGEVLLWDVATGKTLLRWTLPDDLCMEVFSPDLKLLVTEASSGSRPYEIKLWDVFAGKQVGTLPGRPCTVAFSPDSKTLVAPDYEFIRLWDVASRKEIKRVKYPGRNYSGIALWPDNQTLVTWGFVGNTIHFFDLGTGKRVGEFDGHENGVLAIAYSPDGKLLASAEYEVIRVWDVASGKEIRRFPGCVNFLIGIAFIGNSKAIVAVSANKAIHLWDVATGKEIRRTATQLTHRVAFTADGRTLATWPDASLPANGMGDAKIRLWDMTAGKEVRAWPTPPQQWLSALAFSPDGKMLASDGGPDRSLHLRDVATAANLRTIGPHPLGVQRAAFSPDGKTLAGLSDFDSIHLWEVATGRERRVIITGGRTTSFAFSRDGRILATVNDGLYEHAPREKGHYSTYVDWGQVRLWDVATGKEIHRFGDHRGGVSALAFSPDGKRLASASHDTTVLLWDMDAALPGKPKPPARLSPKDLSNLWNDLSGTDAAKAYRAIWALADAPGQSVPFLSARVHPIPPPDAAQVARLIADLDSDRFEMRERASRELEKLGGLAKPALRKTLAGEPSGEVRRRLEKLLAKGDDAAYLPEQRAVEVLEHIATPEARELLRTLGGGAADARLTREAKAALKRLGQ